jgi:hypothetical protein
VKASIPSPSASDWQNVPGAAVQTECGYSKPVGAALEPRPEISDECPNHFLGVSHAPDQVPEVQEHHAF